ncbi:MAG: metal-dependent hydrolase [Desulfobacterales bacterium]|nr:metal-dependent hydrolase [Desulfobacterales bacterium]
MAGFKIHLLGGMTNGALIAGICLWKQGFTPIQAGAVFIAGTIGGLLPDVDSDTSRPLTLLFQLMSVLIPAILYQKASKYGGKSPEFMICYFAISYIFINYVICEIIKELTVHRGIMHSIPFAFLCGGIGYLLFSQSGKNISLSCGVAVFTGCLVHLILDEFNSFSFKFGLIPVVKRSSGTALKLGSESVISTAFVYLLTVCIYLFIVMPEIESSIKELIKKIFKG